MLEKKKNYNIKENIKEKNYCEKNILFFKMKISKLVH